MQTEIEILKQQNEQLQAQLDKTEDNQQRTELIKSIEENKDLMANYATYSNKRNGVTLGELRKIVDSKPHQPKYETGVTLLDELLGGGIESGMFVNFAGASGVGKTHLMLEILMNISQYKKSVYFSFEMSDKLALKKIDDLNPTQSCEENLIIDRDSRKLEEIIREITLYAEEGVKFFVVDSKMKIDVHGNDDDYKKFAKITKELSRLTQTKDVIVFLINQLSEDSLKSGRKAFKGGGDQLYDTDIALFYESDKKGKRVLHCTKNRQNDILKSIETFLDMNNKTKTVGFVQEVEYKADMEGFKL